MSSQLERSDYLFDLTEGIPSAVKESQADYNEGQLLGKVDGLYELFPLRSNFFVAERISKRVRADMGWFEGVINHAPSVGSFYEALLRSALREVLPGDHLLSSGFVYSAKRESPSKQLDLIVYKDSDAAPLYRQEDFAVVQADSVLQIGECKKSLRKQDVVDVVDKTIFADLGAAFGNSTPFPNVNIFAFSSKSSTAKIFDWIVRLLEQKLSLLKRASVDGRAVSLGIRSMNLPQIFFMDRGEYISTVYVRDGLKCEGVDVSIITCHERPDTLPEFLESMTLVPRSTDRSFLTYDLRNVGRTTKIPSEIFLYRQLSLTELVYQRPDWKADVEAAVRRAEEEKLALHAILVSAFVDLEKLPTLEALTRTPLYREQTLLLGPSPCEAQVTNAGQSSCEC